MSGSLYETLLSYLKSLGSCAVAFSGGVDSSLVLFAASRALPGRVIALTARTLYTLPHEIEEGAAFAERLGVPHRIIDIPFPPEIRDNPRDRCYLCKRRIFTTFIEYAREAGYGSLVDGTNADDEKEYRPGMRALTELGVASPLRVCGITKQEVRELSKELGLSTWDKPSYACFLSRIPYGTRITEELVGRIREAEAFLKGKGFRDVRVRVHGELARIEVGREERKLFFDETLLDEVSDALKGLGFQHVTMELSGYRSGSFDRKDDDERKGNP